MLNLYDVAYGLGVGLSAPIWLLRPAARRKVFKAFAQRMGRIAPRPGTRPAVMIHAVSLGEMNATRALVQGLSAARPELQFIVSTTTDTGFEAGQKAYGQNPDVTLVRYPLDFSGAVGRALDALWPSAVVLMELEIWPNFLLRCRQRGTPVVVVNGRLTEPSFKRYRWFRWALERTFGRLAMVCAQDDTYAQRFAELGVAKDRIRVTGTMKFDTAQIVDRVAGAEELAAAVGLRPNDERVWVCGSTGPGEEKLVLDQYRTLLAAHPKLRLVIVPRHPERFDEVAKLIEDEGFVVVRRSGKAAVGTEARRHEGTKGEDGGAPVVLGDTMGELRKFYSLADVVFVGRTLVDLGPRQHGSDMIEPSALGRPVVVGPFTNNFADAMGRFRASHAIVEVADGAALGAAVTELLSDPQSAAAMGRRAREVVKREQGATQRHIEAILACLPMR